MQSRFESYSIKDILMFLGAEATWWTPGIGKQGFTAEDISDSNFIDRGWAENMTTETHSYASP